jgi:hypothetical protein
MRIALIHDHLTQKGGAEKVLEAFSELYPNAPITWQTTGTIIVSAIFYKEYTAAPADVLEKIILDILNKYEGGTTTNK